MKKKISLVIFLLLVYALAVGAWFYGYYNRKSNDNLPALASIAEMDEADVNTLLFGYKRIQLIEVWGEPVSVQENEDIWKINDNISIRVNSNNKGEVVICGLMKNNKSSKEESGRWVIIPMVVVNGKLYLDTGKESTETERWDGFDGEITSEVDGSKKPIKDNESNFGTGFRYQYGSQEDTLEIYMNDKWCIFATEEVREQMLFPKKEDENILKEGYSRYQNGVFGYSVDFPVTWICETEPFRYGTIEANGDPDSGVRIYPDDNKENFIRVYGQSGQITTGFVVQSGWKKTDFDENYKLYVSETDDFYKAQLFFKDNKHISASINMETNVYKEHEEEIMNVLKSITWE